MECRFRFSNKLWLTLPCSTLPLDKFQTTSYLFAFWSTRPAGHCSTPDLHRSSMPWVYIDGGCGMKHLGLQWYSLTMIRRGKNTCGIFWLLTVLTSKILKAFFKSNLSHAFHIALSWNGPPCLSMSQLGLIKQLRVRAAEHPWMRREARAHTACRRFEHLRTYTWDLRSKMIYRWL